MDKLVPVKAPVPVPPTPPVHRDRRRRDDDQPGSTDAEQKPAKENYSDDKPEKPRADKIGDEDNNQSLDEYA